MKKASIIALIVFLFIGVNTYSQSKSNTVKMAVLNEKNYALFGENFALKNIMTSEQMLKKYKSIKKGDSVQVKFKSKIKDVCQKKGCWMNLILSTNDEAFVKFKDYGFFVPLNADGSECIVNGYASVDVVSVDELKHYAKDAGKSQAEINKITKPEVTYAFKASGVYIKK